MAGAAATGPDGGDRRRMRDCPRCREPRAPARWYSATGGTVRGDALGLEEGDVERLCPTCWLRLDEWLTVDETLLKELIPAC
jgi:hypothetical protein